MNPAFTISGRVGSRLLLGALLAATMVGAWGVYLRFFGAGEPTNTTQIVPWGIWVATYIYFIGLSAGGFIISSLAYGFGVVRFERVARLALLQSLVCLLIAMGVIFVDLGHPWRSFRMLWQANPTSVMAWLFFLYNLYFALVTVELYLSAGPASNRRLLQRLALVGLPLAVVVHGGVGTIFAAVKAHPVWHSGLLPLLFVISAVASGGAVLTLLVALLLRRSSETTALMILLGRFSGVFLLIEALMIAVDHFVVRYGNIPAHAASYRLITAGPFPWVFWIGEIAIGLIIPLALLFWRGRDASVARIALAAAAIVIGTYAVRLNLVIPPLAHPVFPELPQAVHHPRWSALYVPSAVEGAVVVGAFAATAWLLLLGRKLIALEGGTSHVHS